MTASQLLTRWEIERVESWPTFRSFRPCIVTTPTSATTRRTNRDASPKNRMPIMISLRDFARALDPDRPVKALAMLARAPRATAKSWYTAHRRPPIAILKMLQDEMEARKLWWLVRELDNLIRRRTWEPRHR